MEDSAIREGFTNLKPSTEYDALYEAALSRERADWIVGINATRLFSVLYGQTLNVGRVMTPTLGMAVMREAAISAFRSEPFYTVQQTLDYTQSLYEKKLVTYPRTDSRYLTEDMADGLPEPVSRVAQTFEKRGDFAVNATGNQ